ncbi:hypothetical protein F5B20DRAFT_538436 [Whalleya microplaca]|nr:hypothetical protein F5B20DRAFT_538436 [Whalleya microplaca]
MCGHISNTTFGCGHQVQMEEIPEPGAPERVCLFGDECVLVGYFHVNAKSCPDICYKCREVRGARTEKRRIRFTQVDKDDAYPVHDSVKDIRSAEQMQRDAEFKQSQLKPVAKQNLRDEAVENLQCYMEKYLNNTPDTEAKYNLCVMLLDDILRAPRFVNRQGLLEIAVTFMVGHFTDQQVLEFEDFCKQAGHGANFSDVLKRVMEGDTSCYSALLAAELVSGKYT